MSIDHDRESVIHGSATAFVRLSWHDALVLLILIYELVRMTM